jgi:hypothetical protein
VAEGQALYRIPSALDEHKQKEVGVVAARDWPVSLPKQRVANKGKNGKSSRILLTGIINVAQAG